MSSCPVTALSFAARRQVIERMAPFYRGASLAQKALLLDQVVLVTGYARKYAIGLLNRAPNKGVTANSLAPGATTRLYQVTLPQLEQAHREGKLSDEMWEVAKADLGPTTHVAPIVTWLCTDAAAGVTGHVFNARGGKISRWSDYEEVRSIFRGDPRTSPPWSLVSIFAQQLLGEQPFPIRQAAWYTKALPTFSDTLAFVRQHLWPSAFFSVSSRESDTVQIPRALFDRFVDTLAFAAS